MSIVDLVLIALALLFALSGFRQGLLVSATSILGFLGGAVLGAQLSGAVADRINGSTVTRVFAALVVVLAGALLGQILFGAAGRALRKRVTWEPAKMVDSVAGAVVSAASVLERRPVGRQSPAEQGRVLHWFPRSVSFWGCSCSWRWPSAPSRCSRP